jgi:hypothetical protein
LGFATPLLLLSIIILLLSIIILLLSLLDYVECLRLAPLRILLKVTQLALKAADRSRSALTVSGTVSKLLSNLGTMEHTVKTQAAMALVALAALLTMGDLRLQKRFWL